MCTDSVHTCVCTPFRGVHTVQAPTGVTRRAVVRVHSCHSPVLAGLDADRAALAVAVDPYGLTMAGEVWALRRDRPTYLLHAGRLERRDRWSIAGTPAGIAVVMAEHRCGLPPPPEMRTPPAPPVRQLEQVAW